MKKNKNKKPKLLVIGPDIKKSKGGMATVIKQEKKSKILNKAFNMHIFSSYIEGSSIKRYLYSGWKIFCGNFVIPHYDILHIHMTAKGSMRRKLHYAECGERLGKTVIIQIHCCDYFLDNFYKLPIKRQEKAKKILQKSNKILCLSQDFQKRMETELELNNCEYLPNGIDLTKYKYQPVSEPNLLYLGKINKDKGVYDLVEALRLLKEEGVSINTTIAGIGEMEEVKALSEKYNLNISLPGWADKKKKKELLKNANCLVLPSYHEGFPVVILEAFSSGCKVVATDVGAISELVDTNLKPGDIKTLAEKIKETLSETGDETVFNNLYTAKRMFSIDVIHENLKNIIEKEILK